MSRNHYRSRQRRKHKIHPRYHKAVEEYFRLALIWLGDQEGPASEGDIQAAVGAGHDEGVWPLAWEGMKVSPLVSRVGRDDLWQLTLAGRLVAATPEAVLDQVFTI